MKKIISALAAFALVLSVLTAAFAQGAPKLSVRANRTQLRAGESLTLTFEIDRAVENLMNFQLTVCFDSEAYEKTGDSVGTACAATVVGEYNGSYDGLIISGLSTSGEPFALQKGQIATLTLRAKESITQENAAIEVKITAMNDYDTLTMPEGGVELVGGSIAVTLAQSEPESEESTAEPTISSLPESTQTTSGAPETTDSTAEAETPVSVAVSGFVELDGATLLLVTAMGENEQAFAYDGNVMYHLPNYGENVYGWLVLLGKEEAPLSAESAGEKITAVSAPAAELPQNGDLDGDGKTDEADARLVYALYRGTYGEMDMQSLSGLLRADVNGDRRVNTADVLCLLSMIS